MDNNQAIKLIGTNIKLYGHFESSAIPYENEKEIFLEKDVTKEEFLILVSEYYNSERLNRGYGNSISEQNSCKKFVKQNIDESCYDLGIEWLNEQKFKEI